MSRAASSASSRGPATRGVEIQPDGHTVEIDLEVTSSADEVRVLTGTVPPQSTITGTKFHDQNANGTRDPLEPGLEGWTIRAYEDDGDGTLAAAEDTLADEATTNASGAYQLDLSPGTYVVCEATQPNWHQSAPANSACDAVDDLAPGGHPLTVESGTPDRRAELRQLHPRQPAGREVPRPERERHPRSARAPGSRAGRSAPMRTTATAPSPPPRTLLADEATTNASGAYQLDLSPGTYVVCEATQPNWHQSAPGEQRLRRRRRPRPRRPPADGRERHPDRRAELRQLHPRQPAGREVPRPERERHPRSARARARGLDDPRL